MRHAETQSALCFLLCPVMQVIPDERWLWRQLQRRGYVTMYSDEDNNNFPICWAGNYAFLSQVGAGRRPFVRSTNSPLACPLSYSGSPSLGAHMQTAQCTMLPCVAKSLSITSLLSSISSFRQVLQLKVLCTQCPFSLRHPSSLRRTTASTTCRRC